MPNRVFREASLCRTNGKTCGACCWGVTVSRSDLETLLERHRKSFLFWTRDGTVISKSRLFFHETWCRRGKNIIWSLALRLPVISERLKQHLARNLTCAFMGFDTEQHKSVGCMLHPTRFEGEDVRQAAAFRLLPGIECGDPGYVCQACSSVNQLTEPQRSAVAESLTTGDWYEYTRKIRFISAGLIVLPEVAEPGNANELLPILPERPVDREIAARTAG